MIRLLIEDQVTEHEVSNQIAKSFKSGRMLGFGSAGIIILILKHIFPRMRYRIGYYRCLKELGYRKLEALVCSRLSARQV
jgi:hypothetical protein